MHWERIDNIFRQAVRLSPDQQADFLERECGTDEELRHCVEQWLEHDRNAEQDHFLEWNDDGTIASHARKTIPDPLVGCQLGSYRLVEKIADGGTGVIYRADRIGDFEQQVAIKILRMAFQDEGGRQRFRAEKQALADLAHPNIARLLDADTAPDGSPYLVMELVEGGPIDEYCECHDVPMRQRLEWFHTICRTVAFAHGKGIIHRDLKPGNVLITQDARPVVTDFGLAKFLRGPHAAHACTSTGAILGTPGYMAPEQADGTGHRIGVSTDVYGLGTILYVLLTGRPPFRGDSLTDTLAKIKMEDPVAPCKLVTTVSRDLDTICRKCLEKDPTHRYASAVQLADDVQCYLGGLPVTARPIGWPQRSIRWIARNPVVSALFLVIAASLMVVSGLLILAESRREHAEKMRRTARATVDKMFTETSKWLAERPQTEELQLNLLAPAQEAYEQLSRDTGNDPEIQAESATATFRLALIKNQLGQDDEALVHWRDALERFQALARRFPDRYQYRFDIFHCHFAIGEFEEAFHVISKLCNEHPLPEYRDALAAAASSYGHRVHRQGDSASARKLFRLGMETARKLSAEFPNTVAYRRHIGSNADGLSLVFRMEGNFTKALEWSQRATRVGRELWVASPNNSGYAQDYCLYCIARADCAFRLGQLDTVRKSIQTCESVASKWVKNRPDVPASWTHLVKSQGYRVELERLMGNTERAKELAVKSLATIEECVTRWPSEISFQVRLLEFLADCQFEELRDIERASALLDSLPADQLLAIGELNPGIVRLRNGQLDQAIQDLRTSVANRNEIAHAYLALAYSLKGDDDAAHKALSEGNEENLLAMVDHLRCDRIIQEVRTNREP